MKMSGMRILLLLAVVLPWVATALAFAAEAQAPAAVAVAYQREQDPFYKLLLAAFVASFSIIAFFLQRSLKQNDDNNQAQWSRINRHETRLSIVEGRCESNHGGTRRGGDSRAMGQSGAGGETA